MKRSLLSLALGVVVGAALGAGAGIGAVAVAQTGKTDAQPCRYDRERFCYGVEKGQGRVVNCLLRHWDQLMPACKKELESRGRRK